MGLGLCWLKSLLLLLTVLLGADLPLILAGTPQVQTHSLSIATGPVGAIAAGNEDSSSVHLQPLRVYRRAGREGGLVLESDLVKGQRLLVAACSAGETSVCQLEGGEGGGRHELVGVGSGVLGLYKLPLGYYLAVAKRSMAAPDFAGAGHAGGLLGRFGRSVRELREIELIRIPPSSKSGQKTTSQERGEEEQEEEQEAHAEAVAMLQETFERHRFFFSLRSGTLGDNLYYDVTRGLQSNVATFRRQEERGEEEEEREEEGHWSRCDERFFWNEHTLAAFLRSGCAAAWLTPVSNAWAASQPLPLGGARNYTLSLISRRSRLMQGPRYIKRGSDEQGNVANFAETEQILSCSASASQPMRVAAYLQVRGSVPLFWSQPDVWRLRPSIVPQSDRDLRQHAAALGTHLRDLFKYYVRPAQRSRARKGKKKGRAAGNGASDDRRPSVFLLNLIDKKGGQGRLGQWLFAALDFLQRNASTAALWAAPARSAVDVAASGAHAQRLQAAVALAPAAATALPPRIARMPGLLDRDAVTAQDFSVAGLGRTRLVWFDYHQKCHGSDVSALKSLYPHVRVSGKEDGAGADADADFFVLGDSAAGRLQSTVVRTNCIDCLDRTNVVQTVVARWALLRQLRLFDELRSRPGSSADALQLPFPQAEAAFRKLWADNGDHLSLLYAGTRALKRDVTREGRRTNRGAFDDGVNSAMRYYINNYKDAHRQRGVDLVLGLGLDDGAGTSDAEEAPSRGGTPARGGSSSTAAAANATPTTKAPTAAAVRETAAPAEATFHETVDVMMLELLAEARLYASSRAKARVRDRQHPQSSTSVASSRRSLSLLQLLLRSPPPLLLAALLLLAAVSKALGALVHVHM